jgi:integrase
MRAETNVRTGFLADEAYEKLRDAITEPEIKLFFVVAYHSGVRKSELLSLRWPQVDLESGFIDLNPETTKNGEGRRVPILSGDMLTLLTEAKQFRDQSFPRCEGFFTAQRRRW